MAMNVITTTDKVQRDAIYKDLRENGDELEKQAVKFSGARLVEGAETGGIRYCSLGKGGVTTVGKLQPRPVYESTFSVAYPLPAPERKAPNHGSARNPRKFPSRKVRNVQA
jgi:hypothetical protein